ncbi:MAG: type 4a pilus biogenesis protein PilO [Acidimicrobiales bacterium]|jgi:Tfp pilus assembly protein PilO
MNRLRHFNFEVLKSKALLITTGCVIVLLVVWWFAWMTPESNKLSTVQNQVTLDQGMVTQLNLQLAGLKADKAYVQRELPFLKKVTTAIPPTPDPPGIVDSLNTLATKTGCTLLSVTPADAPSATTIGGLYSISTSISITGSHKAVFAFLSGFYSMPRLMTITSVALSSTVTTPNILAVNDGQAYSMSIDAMAYTTYAAPA